MNKTVLLPIFLMLFFSLNAQTNYFVSLTGNDSNSGLNESNAWRTIAYAVSSSSPVIAEDTVFIKAGNYGNENVVFQKSGTASHPIVIQGYQTAPGDNPNLDYTYGDSLNQLVMPLLDGGNRAEGIGIDINGSAHISIQNIQITNYEYGVYTNLSSTTKLVLDNIVIMSIGNVNASYSGFGINIISSENNIIRNCTVINSSAEGIKIIANNNLIENCQVYCDEDTTNYASTDYYIIGAGNGNVFRNCYIERVGNLTHIGHGMGLKTNCENNLFENCIAKNMKGGGFYVRHRGVKYNEFKNCKAIGTISNVLGFLVRDGASNNTFNNCYSEGCSSGVRFTDSIEDEGAQYCGRYNTFNNCIINNSIWAIEFIGTLSSPADNNLFSNCIFNNGTYLFETEKENYDNKMVNCIVSNFQTLSTGSEPLIFEYSFSDFYNNGFSTPTGVGNITANPLFVNSSINDFHLQLGSPCIDTGTMDDAPAFDYEEVIRPQGSGIDIGAFEKMEALGLNENNSIENIAYPNPTSGKIFLPNKFNNMKYQVFSSSGIIVQQGTIITNEIDLFKLKTGFYFIKINSNESKEIKTIKFIKE